MRRFLSSVFPIYEDMMENRMITIRWMTVKKGKPLKRRVVKYSSTSIPLGGSIRPLIPHLSRPYNFINVIVDTHTHTNMQLNTQTTTDILIPYMMGSCKKIVILSDRNNARKLHKSGGDKEIGIRLKDRETDKKKDRQTD